MVVKMNLSIMSVLTLTLTLKDTITMIDAFTTISTSNSQSKNKAPFIKTQLEMGKNNERAKFEKSLENMMGDDWKFVRAQLVAQERAEMQLIPKSKTTKNEATQMEESDKDLGQQAHIANAFAGAIASIFTSSSSTDSAGFGKGQKVLHDKQPFDGIDGIGSTGESAFICEDPFASEAEIIATSPVSKPIVELNRHRWAHPISHIEPGCVLVANEKLGGIFHQTVVLIVDHHPNTGTTGIVINR